MNKYRIVKNGLDQYFIEKLQYEELPYKECINGCMQPRKKEKWIRCDYLPTLQQVHEVDPFLKYGRYKAYESMETAKVALEEMKEKELKKMLESQIEVVYEE
jgi:hypothetical protein